MPEEQAGQKQAVAMPQVNTNLLAGDDYQYEPKPLPDKPFEEGGQAAASGGMASQFSIVSSALNKNI